jgi:hypothetical protein
VPTIHHRSRFKMVGTLSLCPPYDAVITVRAQLRSSRARIRATRWLVRARLQMCAVMRVGGQRRPRAVRERWARRGLWSRPLDPTP